MVELKHSKFKRAYSIRSKNIKLTSYNALVHFVIAKKEPGGGDTSNKLIMQFYKIFALN